MRSVNAVLFALVLHVATSRESVNFHEKPPRNSDIPWVTNVINKGLTYFTPAGLSPNSLCTAHGLLYREFASNFTLWAIQMLDATARGPSGLLNGNNFDFGDFDECVDINVAVGRHRIRGKYVIVRYEYFSHFLDWSRGHNLRVYSYPEWDKSAWAALQKTEDPRVKQRNLIHWAMCVPDSCSEDDIAASVNRTITPVLHEYGMRVNVTIDRKFTYSHHEYNKRFSDLPIFLFMAISLTLIGFAITSTFCDIKYGQPKPEEKIWFNNFSVITNFKKLSDTQNQEFASISGMKVISMFIIIYGHRMMISLFAPWSLFNQYYNEMLIGELMHTYIKNGALVVNTFLAITGFLTFNKILKDIERNNEFSILSYVYRRWMRLTPAYAFIMAFAVIVYPRLNMGPLGRSVVFDSACNDYWWTHILYINNYVYRSHQCLIPSYYMAVDMQLYVVCSILGYILFKSRKLGFFLLGALTAASVILPAISVWVNKFNGVYLFFFKTFEYLFNEDEFNTMYIMTHFRAAPYFIGMVGALVYKQLKEKKCLDLSVRTRLIVFSIVFFCFNVSLLGAWIFFIPGREYDLAENVTYSLLYPIFYTVPLCWVIIDDALFKSFYYKITVSHKFFQYLNGLTYSALLVHTLITLYLAGTSRSPAYYTTVLSIWMGVGDVCVAYLAALLLYLIVEGPLAELQNLKFSNCFMFSKGITSKKEVK